MFLHLTLPGGDPVAVNSENIVTIAPYEEQFTIIYFNYLQKNGSPDNVVITQSFDEVKNLLKG